MSEQLVAITRQDGRLSAIVSRAHVQEEKPTVYDLGEVAPDGVKTAHPGERSALAGWPRLDEVRLDDGESVASAIGILLATVPLGAPASGASAGEGRAWLCQPAAWAGLRAALLARPSAVLRALRRQGWGPAVERLPGARDPYAAYHHAAPDAPPLQSLPPRFRSVVLPLLRGRSWSDVLRARSVFLKLELGREPVEAAVAVRVLVEGRAHGPAWLERVQAAEPARRAALADLILRSGAVGSDPGAVPTGAFERCVAAPRKDWASRVAYLLSALRAGVPPADALEEMQVASDLAPGHRFGHLPPVARHGALPAGHGRRLRRVVAHVRRHGKVWGSGFAVSLWRWSVLSPARAEVLSRPQLLSWPAATAGAVLASFVQAEPSEWTEIERFTALQRLLDGVPATHHERAIDEAAAIFTEGRIAPEELSARLDLVARLARPPSPATPTCCPPAWLILGIAGRRCDRVARLSDPALRQIARSLDEEQGSTPRRAGLRAMGAVVGGFLFDSLERHPQPTIAVARLVGLLSPPRAQGLLKRFRALPVASRRLERRPLDELCEAVEPWVCRGVPSPLPRKLRQHREGVATLSQGSLERHRQAIVRRLPSFRLCVIRRLVLDEIGAGPAEDAERHAREMLGSVPTNRRLLRRVLRVAPPERERSLEEHPANRAWFARHPRVDAPLWRHGLCREAPFEGGRLRLQFERDPLELLRMGTRVGSCLSVGGINSGSAVAVMADANKRVVFARDVRGGFVARQLVTLTEDDRVVCAPVYPHGAPAPVQGAFLDYDRALARALGLPLVTSGDYCYVVAPVVARDYYDDGVWERIVDVS